MEILCWSLFFFPSDAFCSYRPYRPFTSAISLAFFSPSSPRSVGLRPACSRKLRRTGSIMWVLSTICIPSEPNCIPVTWTKFMGAPISPGLNFRFPFFCFDLFLSSFFFLAGSSTSLTLTVVPS